MDGPFDYLTKVQQNALEAKVNPANWLPWSYKQTPADVAA